MTKPASIHIGLNRTDPSAYGGWSAALSGCENDARAMAELATAQGFSPTPLLGGEATVARVLAILRETADKAIPGQTVLVTFSGHGASLADRKGRDEEPDQRDEAWCLFDGLLLDDEIHDRMCAFPSGVRILVVSDSCFSGSVTRGAPAVPHVAPPQPARRDGTIARPKRLPRPRARTLARTHADVYQARRDGLATTARDRTAASVLLLAACADLETASDGDPHGHFTAALLEAWDKGAFVGDHEALHRALVAALFGRQQPQLFFEPPADLAFVAARPFTP